MIIPTKSVVWRLLALPAFLLVAGCGSPEQRSEDYYQRGMALIAKGDDLNARLELLNAVKYKSDKVEVWRALAGVDERTKAKSYFNDLRRIVELDPNDLDARIKLARIMLASGAAEAASKVIENVREGDKPSAGLHALKALILAKTNDLAAADLEAQRALQTDPNNIDAILVAANKKLSDGDFDAALKLLASVPVDPKDELRVSLLKIQIYLRKGDLPQAEPLLKKLASQYPSNPAYRNELIQVYIAERRFDEAEKELRGFAAANPADSQAGLNVVRFLNGTKGPLAAREELAARIKAGGDVFDYQMALAELGFTEGKIDESTKLLQQLIEGAGSADRKVTAKMKLAEIYVSKSNFSAAEPLIAEVLAKDRHSTTALRLRAAIRIEQGQFDTAIADLREALNDQPKSPELLTLMAIAYERSGKNELAERQFADALKSSSLNPNVGLQYVGFLRRRGDNAHAENVLTEIAARNPRNIQILSTLAEVRLAQKNWPGALAVADAIAPIDKRGLADQIRASAFAGQNKIDESIAVLEKEHAALPDAVQPVVSLVATYVRQGVPDKAEALLKDMIKKYPDNAAILVLMGQTKLAQKKDDEAAQNFKLAIAKQPKDPSGYSALSDFYIRQKNYNAAAEVNQSGLKELPDNVTLRLAAANLQILKGDQPAAIAVYEAILKDQPNSMVAINNLVNLLLDFRSDKKSLAQAAALAERLKSSNVPQFVDTVGWSQFKAGDFKQSVATLEAAEAKAPNIATIRYHLGMGYASTGQAEKAAEQFKAALALEPDGTPLKDMIRAAMK